MVTNIERKFAISGENWIHHFFASPPRILFLDLIKNKMEYL